MRNSFDFNKTICLASLLLALSVGRIARGQTDSDSASSGMEWNWTPQLSPDSILAADTTTVSAEPAPAQGLDVTPSTQPANPTTESAEHPDGTPPSSLTTRASGFALEEAFSHLLPYEPVYFIGGPQSPNVKFQFSFRYLIFTPNGTLTTKDPILGGLNFSYSQTSLWNVSAPSAPFFDTNYRPEFFYYNDGLAKFALLPENRLGLQTGIGHESNGRDGTASRSINVVYARPTATFPLGSDDTILSISPRVYEYLGDLSDNPDIRRYRGYTDLHIVLGSRRGVQLAFIGRLGTNSRYGSAQFDLTGPIARSGISDILWDVQYFVGDGESLLTYNEKTSAIRIGFSLVR